MLNGRFVLEDEYSNKKACLERKLNRKITWSDIIKKGIEAYEMEASFGPEEQDNG